MSKASSSYGGLIHRLWPDRGVELSTKTKVFRAVALTYLPYMSVRHGPSISFNSNSNSAAYAPSATSNGAISPV